MQATLIKKDINLRGRLVGKKWFSEKIKGYKKVMEAECDQTTLDISWNCEINFYAFKKLFNFFHKLYFDQLLSSPSMPPRSYLLPYPPKFMFWLSQIENKKWKSRQTKHNQQCKQLKTKQNAHTRTTKQKQSICFVLARYSWTWDMPWTVADILNDILLEIADFPIPAGICRWSITGPTWLPWSHTK